MREVGTCETVKECAKTYYDCYEHRDEFVVSNDGFIGACAVAERRHSAVYPDRKYRVVVWLISLRFTRFSISESMNDAGSLINACYECQFQCQNRIRNLSNVKIYLFVDDAGQRQTRRIRKRLHIRLLLHDLTLYIVADRSCFDIRNVKPLRDEILVFFRNVAFKFIIFKLAIAGDCSGTK